MVRHFRRYSMAPLTVPLGSNVEVISDEEEEPDPKDQMIERVIEKSKEEILRLSNYGMELLKQVNHLEEENTNLKSRFITEKIDKDAIENDLYESKQEKVRIGIELEQEKRNVEEQTQAFDLLREDYERLQKRLNNSKRENKSLHEQIEQLKYQAKRRRRRHSIASPTSSPTASPTSPSASPQRTRPSNDQCVILKQKIRNRSGSVPNKKSTQAMNKLVEKTKYRLERRLSRANNLYHTKLQETQSQEVEVRKDLVRTQLELFDMKQSMERNGLALKWIEENSSVLENKVNGIRNEVKNTRIWCIQNLNLLHEDFNKAADLISNQLISQLKSANENLKTMYPSIQQKVIQELGVMELYSNGRLWPSKKGKMEVFIIKSSEKSEPISTIDDFKKLACLEDNWEEMFVIADIKELKIYETQEMERLTMNFVLSSSYCRFHDLKIQDESFSIIEIVSKKESHEKMKKKKKRRRGRDEEEEKEEEESCFVGLRFCDDFVEWKSFFKFLLPELL